MGADKAMVLLVHGSRDAAWMKPFHELARDVEQQSGMPVRIACLQICEPNLADALCELAEQNVGAILVAPVFISALGHVLKDVPAEVEKAKAKFPDLKLEVLPAIGEMEQVQAAFRAALAAAFKSSK